MINGVDLSRVRPGDVVEVTPRDAGILLTEGWALPWDEKQEKDESSKVVQTPGSKQRAEAAEQSAPGRLNRGGRRR